MKHFLLTGATGCVGAETLTALMKRFPEAKFTVMGRTKPKARVNFIQADLNDFAEAMERAQPAFVDATHIVHIAADVRWNLSAKSAWQRNTEPTRLLAQHAARHSRDLQQFVYVSTAFVDSIAHDKFTLGATDSFNNTYEYSKFQAEAYLWLERLPQTIIRPAIVIGDSQSGVISRFNGLYQLLNLFVQETLPVLIGHEGSTLDVITVDRVVSSILWAIEQPRDAIGRVVYCSNGQEAPTLKQLMTLAAAEVNATRAPGAPQIQVPKLVSPETFQRFYLPMIKKRMPTELRRILYVLEYFQPYLKITKPRRFSQHEPVFMNHDINSALSRCVRYYLDMKYETNQLRGTEALGQQ